MDTETKYAVIQCRPDKDLSSCIDLYIRSQEWRPSAASIVERALMEFLQNQGFYPLETARESAEKIKLDREKAKQKRK